MQPPAPLAVLPCSRAGFPAGLLFLTPALNPKPSGSSFHTRPHGRWGEGQGKALLHPFKPHGSHPHGRYPHGQLPSWLPTLIFIADPELPVTSHSALHILKVTWASSLGGSTASLQERLAIVTQSTLNAVSPALPFPNQGLWRICSILGSPCYAPCFSHAPWYLPRAVKNLCPQTCT